MMQMRAMVLEEFGGTLTLQTRTVPEPGSGEVLVQVVACGAGLTLESIRSGHLGGSTPRIMGHEYSGTIAALGAGVENWHEGDAVTGSFYLFCGNCVMCSSGRETLCINNKGNIDALIDSSAESWQSDLVEAANGQLDACIDFVGTPVTTSGGIAALGRGGTFVIVGTLPELRSDKSAVISVAPMYLINKEVTITGTRYASRAEIAHSLQLIRDGSVKPIIGASFPLAQAEEALEAIRRNQIFGRVLIDCML